MGRWASDSVIDASLDKMSEANLLIACSQQPANRVEAVGTYAIADVVLAAEDFSKANDTSGRILTVAGKALVDVDTDGTITHLALCDETELLYVTTTNSKIVEIGDKVNIGAFTANLKDPVAIS
jgi:hypothetical protein